MQEKAQSEAPFDAAWAREIAADLQAHRGRSLVVAGARQPPLVHALVQLMNIVLGNVSHSVRYVEVADEDTGSLEELAEDAAAGRVNTLMIVGGNPAYDAPADLELADQLQRIADTIRLGLYEDETAQLCQWRLPAAHAFESWGDAETDDGDYLPVQPLIAPLYDGRSAVDGAWPSYCDTKRIKNTKLFNAHLPRSESRYKTPPPLTVGCTMVSHGVHADRSTRSDPSGGDRSARAACRLTNRREYPPTVWRSVFTADASVFDGRFANLSWLQEMPDPITKLTWDNAALMSVQTASELNLATGDVVRLSLEIGAWRPGVDPARPRRPQYHFAFGLRTYSGRPRRNIRRL